jgi:hypothetical protein
VDFHGGWETLMLIGIARTRQGGPSRARRGLRVRICEQ